MNSSRLKKVDRQPKAMTVQTGNPGQLGKYRLVATLGQGGMGTVYLAFASGLGEFRKLLVVKELRQDLLSKDMSVAMFIDEARLAARLDHPNVVQTFEADQDQGRYFLAMEYLDGQPLSALIERLRTRGGLPLGLHVHVLCEMLLGLHYAHELRDYDGSPLHVVHRDVSPQNVFITYHGQVKVVDFGVAKARNASTLTTPGVFKGKFAYAAPEQASGRPVDARADLFAVGVMLWEAISGQRFSDLMPTPEAFKARLAGREPRIHEVAPDTEPLLADICNRALALDPEQRFTSAEAFRHELQDYLLLTGQRVESAELAGLMREVFAAERVSMHQVIERAMTQGGATESMVEALPFMRTGESAAEATLIADLSGLAEVSHESDDAKIRAHYEVSKITPMRPLGSQSRLPVAPPPAAVAPRPSQRPLIAAAIGGALSLAGALGYVWHARTSVQPPVAATAASAPGVASGSLNNTLKPDGHVQPAAQAAAAGPDRAPQPAAAEQAEPELERAPSEGAARVRARMPVARRAPTAAPRAAEPASPSVASASASASEAKKPESPAEPAMGTDLRPGRRAPAMRIDAEDPYQ